MAKRKGGAGATAFVAGRDDARERASKLRITAAEFPHVLRAHRGEQSHFWAWAPGLEGESPDDVYAEWGIQNFTVASRLIAGFEYVLYDWLDLHNENRDYASKDTLAGPLYDALQGSIQRLNACEKLDHVLAAEREVAEATDPDERAEAEAKLLAVVERYLWNRFCTARQASWMRAKYIEVERLTLPKHAYKFNDTTSIDADDPDPLDNPAEWAELAEFATTDTERRICAVLSGDKLDGPLKVRHDYLPTLVRKTRAKLRCLRDKSD